METPPAERKLTAILSADVAGYSRLMAEHEADTIDTLAAYRRVFVGQVAQFHGRVVDAKGDAILAEFGSVVDAVACAVEIQRELAERNSELPAAQAMQFGIGVNVGDVAVRGEEIYGDGVNVAARLETLAEPGGICISGKAHAEVRGRLPVEFEFLGRQQVKNIPEPVPAFRVLSRPGAAAHRVAAARSAGFRRGKLLGLAAAGVLVAALVAAGMYLAGPGNEPAESLRSGAETAFVRPSLAVLPFTNMSSDPEQEHFADGLTEDGITDLSRLRDMAVIARNSVMAYKGRNVDVRQVGRELGVRYVLEGSVRRSDDELRITAQLIDAETGDHLWSGRYDRPRGDAFQLQDEISRQIVTELEVKVGEGEEARVWRRGTDVPEAYYYTIRGHEAFLRFTSKDNLEARRLLTRAIELDPHFALPHVFMGWTYWIDAAYGFVADRDTALERAWEWADRALELDSTLAEVHSLFGGVHLTREEFDQAVTAGRRAVELNPSSAKSRALYGWFLSAADQYDEALSQLIGAFRLNPNPPAWYFTTIAEVYILRADYDAATERAESALAALPEFLEALALLVIAYSETGRMDAARSTAARIREIDPTFSASAFMRAAFIHRESGITEHYVRLLKAAGLN